MKELSNYKLTMIINSIVNHCDKFTDEDINEITRIIMKVMKR